MQSILTTMANVLMKKRIGLPFYSLLYTIFFSKVNAQTSPESYLPKLLIFPHAIG